MLASARLLAIPVFLGTAAILAGCPRIQTRHAADQPDAAPAAPSDLTVRWIGTPAGSAAGWITTANDQVANRRFDGLHILVDPGSPEEVEQTIIPFLRKHGVQEGARIAYVVLTTGSASGQAGARLLSRRFSVGSVIAPYNADPRGSRRGSGQPELLDVSPEVTVRVVQPRNAAGVPAQALLVRFIDVQFLFLPDIAGTGGAAFAGAVAERLEAMGLNTTVLSAGGMSAVEHLNPEVVVGTGVWPSAIPLLLPAAGEAFEVTTAGSEARAPGPMFRSRYGHWIDCTEEEPTASCAAELPMSESGPTMVRMTVAGTEGWFLVDTRSPLSYLERSSYQAIPGADRKSEAHGHSHGGEPIGLEVPPFEPGQGSMAVRRWHVLPVTPFTIGDREIAGVIGMDLLQSFRVALSPSSGTMTLTPDFTSPRERLGSGARRTEGSSTVWTVPMDRSPAGPLILAKLDGARKSLVVALGAGESGIHFAPGKFEALVDEPSKVTRRSFEVTDDVTAARWTSLDLRTGPFRVRNLDLNGAELADVTLTAVDRRLAAEILGMDFLSRFDRIVLDFRQRTLELTDEPPESSVESAH